MFCVRNNKVGFDRDLYMVTHLLGELTMISTRIRSRRAKECTRIEKLCHHSRDISTMLVGTRG